MKKRKSNYLVIDAKLWHSEIKTIKPLKPYDAYANVVSKEFIYERNYTNYISKNEFLDEHNQYIFNAIENDIVSYQNFEAKYIRNGINKKALKKLANISPNIYLDLHGVNINSAYTLVHNFIYIAYENKYKYVYIIHGKGLSSPNQIPILKPQVLKWLMNLPYVLAFTNAKPQYGGNGATVILIKSS